MPNPYLKPRTPGHASHSSKPTVFYGREGERQRYETDQKLTRRQAALFGQQATIRKGLTVHRKSKKNPHLHGGRRHRKSRYTRRR